MNAAQESAVCELEVETYLGACAQAITDAKTPEWVTAAPELDLILFGKLDKMAATKVTDTLAKIRGVNLTHSKANAENGEITVALKGGARVTASQIHKALQEAGVVTSFTKSMSVARS